MKWRKTEQEKLDVEKAKTAKIVIESKSVQEMCATKKERYDAIAAANKARADMEAARKAAGIKTFGDNIGDLGNSVMRTFQNLTGNTKKAR